MKKSGSLARQADRKRTMTTWRALNQKPEKRECATERNISGR